MAFLFFLRFPCSHYRIFLMISINELQLDTIHAGARGVFFFINLRSTLNAH
jgi:hypothetical protein